jgi:hypothetical protein
VDDERLPAVIRETHKATYEFFGYRRTWITLRRAGAAAPRFHVQRLMAAHETIPTSPRRRSGCQEVAVDGHCVVGGAD